MSSLSDCVYAKMNGLGNQILVLDLRDSAASLESAQIARLARVPNLAFDQLMAVRPRVQPGTEAFVQIYNSDGSEVGACGNGSRCVAWFLLRDDERREINFETAAGVIACRRESEWEFSADMGAPRFAWDEIPVSRPIPDTSAAAIVLDPGDAALGRPSLVSMGNPHAIFWLESLDRFDLGRVGPRLERHPDFPERANISFARIIDRDHIELRVWERGAGLTLACGTAACAAAVAAARLGQCDRRCRVTLPGGDLWIDWRADDHVLMRGPCALEREGRLTPSLLAQINEDLSADVRA
jgi:diaminopimelate epimerase